MHVQKKFSCALILCLAVTLALFSGFCLPSIAASTDKTVTLTGVGDIMMGTHFPTDAHLPPDDGLSLFDGVRDILKAADITFGNLEGALLDEGECIKDCKDPKACFAFKMPERYVNHLTGAGFDLLSIANNHIGDFGLPGRDSTVRILKNAGIHVAGIDSRPYCLFEKNGITFGFSAFAPNVGIPDIRDLEAAAELVRKLDQVCDIVIVSFHGGAEGVDNRRVTRSDEIFYGENRGNVYEFAHRMIDEGADVLLGHGPHVTRAVELYKGRFIAYSLGNFCTYGRFNLDDSKGVAPIIALTLNSEGRFLKGQVTSIFQDYNKGPEIDAQNRALFELIKLTSLDFPETPIVISETGQMRYRD